MRTRSQSYLPSPPTSSPPPISASRKRARSQYSDTAPASDTVEVVLDTSPTKTNSTTAASDAIQTPRKTKRVRFSDPGISDVDALGISSSGLTPSFRKSCMLEGTAHSRRRTLPPRLEHSSSSPPPPAEPLQFLPLRQALDNRLRRRLRRNHLSETVNSIEQEQRDEQKTRRELEQLRASGQHHEDTIRELQFELESQRQRGIAVNAEDDAERAALHDELQRLKFELLHHQDAPPLRERLAIGAPTEVATDIADDMLASPTCTSSPFDFDDAGFDAPSSSPPAAAAISLADRGSPRRAATHAHAGVQTNLPDLIAERTLSTQSRLQSQLTRAQADASAATATLRGLHADLADLGFAPRTSPAPAHLDALRTAFRTTRLALERAAPGETPAGFAGAALLPALLDHAARSAHAAATAAAPLEPLRAEHAALRTNFDAALARANELDTRQTVLLAQAADARAADARHAAHAAELERVADKRAGHIAERDARIDALDGEVASARAEASSVRDELTSVKAELASAQEDAAHARTTSARLTGALASYRAEVSSLEALVERLEGEKSAAGRDVACARGVLEGFVRRLRGGMGRVGEEVEGLCGEVESAVARLQNDESL